MVFDIDGLYCGFAYDMTQELCDRLREQAVEAAIEADVRRAKWQEAARRLVYQKMTMTFGAKWRNLVGTLPLPNGDGIVRLESVCKPSNGGPEAVVIFRRLLKRHQWAKSRNTAPLDYVVTWFRPLKDQPAPGDAPGSDARRADRVGTSKAKANAADGAGCTGE